MEQITTYNDKTKWYEYAILLFIILWSGGGFTYGLFLEWMLYMMPIVGIIFFQRDYKLSNSTILLIGVVLSVHFLQMVNFGGAIINLIKPTCLLLVCAIFAKIICCKFIKVYLDLVCFISQVCLVLWVICLFPLGLSFLRSIASQFPLLGWDNIENNTNIVDTLYIFSIPQDFKGLMRNSGPFWEPGRFTIYITLALAINLFYFKEKITSKKSLVLLLTNLTTFSTTGYVATAVLFVGYIFFSNIKKSYKFILSVILLVVVYYVGQLDFMTEKIAEQSADDSTWSRFGAIAYHWNQITQSPIIGFGPFLSNVFGDELFSPNGLTDLMRYYGIPLSIVFYYLLYRGTKVYVGNSHKGANVCVFVSLLLLCFSQTITYSPFFMILYFLHLIHTRMINKIGILCTYSFPEGMAPTIRILSYGQGLVDNGCKVEVVVFQPKVVDDAYSLSGCIGGVKYTYAHKRDTNKSKLYKLFVDRPKSLLNAIKKIRNSHKEEKFDCILLSFDHPTYLLFFVPVLRIMGIKIGFIGDEFPEPIRRLKSAIPFSYKLAYKFVYQFILFRVLMTEALQRFYDELVCEKPTYILCSILNTARFDGIVKQKVSRKYMCYMGNMMLAKDNVDNIIRAFKRVCDDFSDVDLYLYGTPNDKDKSIVEGVIAELGLGNRVFIKGRIDYNLVPQTLANAEILVTSQPVTKRAVGGFPTKLAEYMMSHTPAIVTNVGEIHYYVQDNNTVYLVEPCDDVAYAEKMRYILSHPQEAKEVAGRAYNYAIANFGSKEVTKKLIDFLDNTL